MNEPLNREASYAKIVQLAEWLREDTPMLWEQVEECVEDFPAWQQLITMLRYRNGGSLWPFVHRAAPADPFEITPEIRSRLFEIFVPYGILLDRNYTLIERACLLEEAGYGAVEFCTRCCENGWQAAEAALVLEAIAEQQNLVRGSERPEVSAAELLRPARPGVAGEDSLLKPSEAPLETASSPAAPAGWLAKLVRSFRKK